jgi:hypothetical protein
MNGEPNTRVNWRGMPGRSMPGLIFRGLIAGKTAGLITEVIVVVRKDGFTPFDALHLVKSGSGVIVSSDGAYDGFAPRFDPRNAAEE